MKKMIFKKILSILDTIELYGVDLHKAPLLVYEELAKSYYSIKLSEIRDLIIFLYEKKMLKSTHRGIDLSPSATIYAKSNQNSNVEALSIFESFIKDSNIHQYYLDQIRTNPFRDKKIVLEYIDRESLQLLLQTTLFEIVEEKIRFHPRLLKGISAILQEYNDDETPLVSITLTAIYTSSIVSHEDMRIDYKNTTYNMIDYRYKDFICSIIPRRGIPHDRDETKSLQAFYKDTLFHEFDHQCPICNISIPHMLIASHIKPFRDCAHIFEAIDHNNGLLLCRNHDYLFDQGYFTFDEKGYIIIGEELLSMDNLTSSYNLWKNYRLPENLMTENRMKFLAYHRTHIFRSKN